MPLSYQEALQALDKRGFGMKPDLTRMRELVEILDHPEAGYPSVHLAGTNGKSSTARMIGNILGSFGLTSGVYTSPHLQSARERFMLCGRNDETGSIENGYIAPQDFAELLDYLLPYVDVVEQKLSEEVTYFELTTLAALEWMAQAAVAAGVLETGMGGTWDATNVVSAGVAVLTHIAVDHARFLGATPIEIAREKVGIIKQGAAVVTAYQDDDVGGLIAETVLSKQGSLMRLGSEFSISSNDPALSGRVLSVEGLHATYEDLFIPLHGPHQGINAAVAVAACEVFLDRALDLGLLKEGLAAVRSPGRIEVVSRDPLIVLDGAHNPDGMSVSVPAVMHAFGARGVVVVLAILEDKDVEAMLDVLIPFAEQFVCTRSGHPHSLHPEVLASIVESRGGKARTAESAGDAVDLARSLVAGEGLVLVIGSLYAVGEARDHLLGPVE